MQVQKSVALLHVHACSYSFERNTGWLHLYIIQCTFYMTESAYLRLFLYVVLVHAFMAFMVLYCIAQLCVKFVVVSASSEEPKKKCTSIAELYGSLSCCALPTQPSAATARGIVNHLSTSSVSLTIQLDNYDPFHIFT